MHFGKNFFYLGTLLAVLFAVVAFFTATFYFYKKKQIVPKKITFSFLFLLCVVLVILAIIAYRGIPWLTIIAIISATFFGGLILFLWTIVFFEPMAKKLGFRDSRKIIDEGKERDI